MTDTRTDRLRGHEFDGIQEFDNRLPNWWLWTFYLACIFSLFYWLHYHVLGTGPSPREKYRMEMEAAEAELTARLAEMDVSNETLTALSKEPTAVAKGREIYVQNCAQCHDRNPADDVVDLGGNVGPNLTDRYWIHGGEPMDLYNTVITGVPAKGMPDYWQRTLGDLACQQVVAFILTHKNTNVEGGKEPQGELVEDS